MSPLQPAGSLFSLPLIPYTAMTYLYVFKYTCDEGDWQIRSIKHVIYNEIKC